MLRLRFFVGSVDGIHRKKKDEDDREYRDNDAIRFILDNNRKILNRRSDPDTIKRENKKCKFLW